MSLGKNLKAIRNLKGLTQGDLSHKSGVALGMISKIERDKVDPTTKTLMKLIKVLDCSADRLMRDKETEGVTGELKEQFERMRELPETVQWALVKIMDELTVAHGLESTMRNHRLLIRASKPDEIVERVEIQRDTAKAS